ncbi:hypothetical protein [Chitinophaga cymbidii]|uniref:Thioredoxin-like fold domain-containing protein n=1 Tax=Chitinophaga cymbidii TaxID=1096750 RepID=A0A512RFV9_9BACT|nr:hypothetical protein [Chitinophaga cymbidii]GEP94575.1 hypothetical protein CCY01nite_08350 [Chitinophaga cymbidii]
MPVKIPGAFLFSTSAGAFFNPDLSFWNNATGQLYGIRSIPSNVLVGPDGVIVAKNLRGEKLFSKLEELLGPASAGE